MTKVLGASAVVEQLLADGVRHVFGNPGTVEQGLLDAIEASDLDYVLALQEAVAVGIADGYARATKQATVVQLHSGVGLGNGIGMLYQAMRGHAPLVVLVGEAGVRWSALEAQMSADLLAMARPVVKHAWRVEDPGSVLRVLRRAMKVAATPPAGPVLVVLPMDVLDAAGNEPVVPSVLPDTRSVPAPDLVARAAGLLAGAQRPLIVVGDGVAASSGQASLVELAELLGADVVGADDSEPNMPWDHPLWRGQLGHMFGEVSAQTTAQADVVLVVGTYALPEVFPLLEGAFAPDARIVHVDLDPYSIGKNHPVTLGLVADPASTLTALTRSLTAILDEPMRASAAARLARRRSERTPAPSPAVTTADGAPLDPEVFTAELARRLPPGSVVVDEALTTSPAVTRHLVPSAPGSYFQTRGGSLGIGIPTAIGVKIADPTRTVVGFTGDGGSMYTFQALWTAARHGIGAKAVVCDNSRYRLLDLNIAQYWKERGLEPHPFPTSFDLGRPAIDFVGLARSLGVEGVIVEKADQVPDAVARMLQDDAPFLVHLVLDTPPNSP